MAQDSHRDHREFHQQQANAYNLAHANHESLHSFLFFFLITFLILSQVGLFLWKKYRYRSFQNTTLIGLWLIPFVFSCYFLFYRMLFVWTLFSAVTFYILAAASKSPLAKETPRQVYQWFYWVYRVCASMAFFGYCLFMLDFLGISRAVTTALFDQPFMLSYFGWMCIFYGLYYGVLGRDCAEMCTDRLASSMGFTGKGLPKKQLLPHQCCICGEAYSSDNSAQLNCGHQFHEFCIRGWTMIGKKDTCPYCSEKVSLKQVFKNPWEKQGILWAHLMDALRYLIVWNPIILFAVQGFLYFVDPGA